MIASDFDKKFDQNRGDIIDDLDLSSQRRPNRKPKRMVLELPVSAGP